MKPLIYDEIERRFEKKSQVASQYKVSSIAYGLFFCLIGIVLNTIEPFKTCKNLKQVNHYDSVSLDSLFLGSKCDNALKIFIECFYIYMYSVSIVWISLMCYFIIRSKRDLKVSIKNPTTGLNRRLSLAPKYNNNLKSKIQNNSLISKMKNMKFLQNINSSQHEIVRLQSINEETRVLGSTTDISKFDFTYDYENGKDYLFLIFFSSSELRDINFIFGFLIMVLLH